MRLGIAILLAGLVVVGISVAQATGTLCLDVQVIDQSTGKIAELLGPGDFEVFDDGRKVSIDSLGIDTPPLDLVLVPYFNPRGLTTREDRRRYAAGLSAAVALLRHEDRVGVVRGTGPKGISLPFTKDSVAIGNALTKGMQPDRDRLFDAVSNAVSLFDTQSAPHRQRAIIALTDDVERNSETSLDALTANMLTSGITLHEVMLAFTPSGPYIHTSPQKKGPLPLPIPQIGGMIRPPASGGSSLVPIVRATGGEYAVGDDFEKTLPALIRRLRLRYLLSIAVPRGDRAFHKIEVRLTPGKRLEFPGAGVTARLGYYSEP